MLKAIILIGGPQKGTRFRPLTLDHAKPLFPIAGRPIIEHHIAACVAVPQIKEILIIGYYPADVMEPFVVQMQQLYDGVCIRYLQEFTMLGTAGGLYHFRDQIRAGNPDAFFVLNGDVCADFPLRELYEFHARQSGRAELTIATTEATKQQSVHYGCLVLNAGTGIVKHYVEKPQSYVSTFINCGVYVASMALFGRIAAVARSRNGTSGGSPTNGRDAGHIMLEREIIVPMAGTGRLFAMPVTRWWSQIKTAAAAIYANRHYLALYRRTHPERLAPSAASDAPRCTIVGDVHVHPSAAVHATATLGPNVSIGPGVIVGPGVRIRESIVLDGAVISDHALVLHSIVGRKSTVGQWARVEGTPSDPDPNKPFAKMENRPLFNADGKLNPSITIVGSSVSMPAEMILLNSIVLPHKELMRSFKNEIIL